MASAQTQETFPCTAEEFYQIISSYEKYPEFLPEVKKCKVLKEEGGKKLVEFDVSLIKTFKYRLWMTEVPGKSIHWTFDSGEVFKTSTGSWVLEPQGAQVKVTYDVDATFTLFVPGPVAKALVSVNLPMMMKNYKERVKKVFGKG
jgi:ribosome-associated toxin RatA of RatAB toxin-antitoxin module